jgi:hypothetical protein
MHSITDYWKVLSLFIIPFGGGIPAGVLVAKKLNLFWPITTLLYFISDLMLALVFEPILILIISMGKNNPTMVKISMAMKEAFNKTTEQYGTSTGPLALIIVAFGVDPMTGRAVAKAAGHGFITGWMIAITGDMLYFLLIMASTLWLNNILGNHETLTTIIIIALMMGIPVVIRKTREKFGW